MSRDVTDAFARTDGLVGEHGGARAGACAGDGVDACAAGRLACTGRSCQQTGAAFSRRGFVAMAAGAASLLVTMPLVGCDQSDDASADASTDGDVGDSGDLLAQIQERGEMIFATEGTWSPWTFHDEGGELVGYDIEVARGIAQHLGVEATFVEGKWDGLFAGLDSQRYDCVSNGVTVTDERAEKYDFTEPYAYNRTVVIVRGDYDEIASMEDLEGKTTANTLASAYALLAESYGAQTQGVDDLNQTIQLLESGRIDATLNDEVVFYDYLEQHPDADLKIAVTDENPTHVAFPLRRGEATQSLLQAMNEAIDDMRTSGELSELSNKYFGLDISQE